MAKADDGDLDWGRATIGCGMKAMIIGGCDAIIGSNDRSPTVSEN